MTTAPPPPSGDTPPEHLGPGGLRLWRSVVDFDTAGAFGQRLARAGFRDVRVLPLPGWQTGITYTFTGRVPA